MKLFETKVIGIGQEASMFQAENMMILFGENAPAELKDLTYHIQCSEVTDTIDTDTFVSFGDSIYQVTAVGDVVKHNLETIGHITIRFDGSKVASLPGTLHLEALPMPVMREGMPIIFEKP